MDLDRIWIQGSKNGSGSIQIRSRPGPFPSLDLTEPRLSVIVSAVLTSKAIFQRMKNYTIYVVSITIHIVMGFMLIALIWEFDFSPCMVLIITILNDGTIMTIAKDRVKPSPLPDSWKLKGIFSTGVVLGTYMAILIKYSYLVDFADESDDPYMRLMYTTSWAISIYYAYQRTWKPFNPTLGETCDMVNHGGITFISEQVGLLD